MICLSIVLVVQRTQLCAWETDMMCWLWQRGMAMVGEREATGQQPLVASSCTLANSSPENFTGPAQRSMRQTPRWSRSVSHTSPL